MAKSPEANSDHLKSDLGPSIASPRLLPWEFEGQQLFVWPETVNSDRYESEFSGPMAARNRE